MTDQRDYIRENFVIAAGLVYEAARFALVGHYEKALASDVWIAQVFVRQDEGWADAGRFKWRAVALARPLGHQALVTLGRDGEVGVWTPGGMIEERVSTSGNIGPLKGLRSIGENVFAFGMRRQVFRRDSQGRWARFDRGLEMVPRPGTSLRDQIRANIGQVGGIHAIAGRDISDLVAVGERGEIWQSDGQSWTRIDSPTTQTLTDVALDDDGIAWACGQSSVILRGERGAWSVVSFDGPEGLDLQAAAWFRGRLYVADGHTVRVLTGGGLESVETVEGELVAAHGLHAANGALLSFAGKEVFVTEDGERWTQIV